MTKRMLMSRVLGAVLALSLPQTALAWKPTTHVYLAEIAVADALDDGKISIPIIGQNRSVEIPVEPGVIDALVSFRAQYHAGVLGPDAFPDIMTGQQIIHPSSKETKIIGGSDAWLQHIWGTFGKNPTEQAFRLGFLTHAAGDMYGHSFINYFTGAPFTFKPPKNAVKHVVLEGYIDKRLPAAALDKNFFHSSINGLSGQIYKQMVDMARNKALRTNLLRPGAPNTTFSIPAIFSTMRLKLASDVKKYDDKLKDYDKKIKNCKLLDFSCSKVALGTARTAYVLANGIPAEYKRAWIKDIDSGLAAWPTTSHQVARALFFNPERKTDTATADKILTDYATKHLLSMAGAPDFVGLTIAAVGKIIDAITPKALQAAIAQFKENMLNTILKNAIGMTKDEMKKYLTSPDKYFDQVMNTTPGQPITLAAFNKTYLKISDPGYTKPSQSFDWQKVPAAYNTVIMSKLIFLAPKQINDLLAEVKAPNAGEFKQKNVMLGFIDTLDGSHQWKSGMAFASACAAYNQIFYPIPGDVSC